MSAFVVNLQTVLERVRADGLALAAELERAATLLREAGVPPDSALREGIKSYRLAFDALFKRFAEQNIFSKQGAITENLLTLEKLLHLTGKHIESISRVGVTLSKMDRLRHGREPEFAPLKQLEEEVRSLRKSLEELAPITDPSDNADLASLIRGDHPFDHVLRWVTEGDLLDDETITRYHELVSTTYGPALATALSRGRIYLLDSEAVQGESVLVAPMADESLTISSNEKQSHTNSEHPGVASSEAPVAELISQTPGFRN